MTMTLVSTVTVGSGGAANIEFTSIPQTGTDLFLVFSGRTNYTGGLVYDNVALRFNSSTTSDYASRDFMGNGSSASGTNYFPNYQDIYTYAATALATSNTFGNGQITIFNYSATQNKSISIDAVTENNSTTSITSMASAYRANTSAITSIKLTPYNGIWVQNSTASLYTITKGSGGATVS